VVADVIDEVANALLGTGDEIFGDGDGVVDDAPEDIADVLQCFPEGVGIKPVTSGLGSQLCHGRLHVRVLR
jgi:hypothetical protein